MYSLFDKHGKKLLAVVGSFLVLAFLLPSTFGTHGGGGGGHLGKINGKSIEAADVQRSINTLRSVDRLVFPTQTGQFAPVSQAIFPQNVQRQFEQNPVLFYLLTQEALQAGAAVPDTVVERFLRSPVRMVVDNQPVELDRVTPAIKDGLREDLRRVLAVAVNADRTVGSAVKISRPLIDDAVATQAQQVRVHLATFAAADFESKVTAPTEDELRRQFTAYADLPAVPNANNPFGFGYRVPDRIAAQWLVVNEADVAKVVEATKSAELWDEDAIIYYQRNTSEFSKTVPPATQPTTQPFETVRADVLKKLRAPLIEQQKRAIANRIVQQLSTLHTSAKKQPATGPSVWLGEQAYTFDALNTVADAIQKQTGVRPTVVAPAGLLSRGELEKQPGFGKSYTTDRAYGFGTGPGTLFDSLRALSKNDSAATLLDLGQPSPVFNADDGNLYVARVVAVEPAHAAKNLDDIKALVDRDVRRSKAFDLAVAAAQATLEKANAAGGLEKAGVTVQTSEFFPYDTPSPAGLTGANAAGWVGPAFEALRGVKSKDALPVRTVARQQNAGAVAVIEVFDVKTLLNTQIEQATRQQAEQEIARVTVPAGLADQWFNFDSVSRRVNYVPDEPRHEAPQPAAPRGPANPFMPG